MNRTFGPFSRRRVLTVAMLTLAWCALWGSITVANLVSGAVVGFLVSVRLVATDGTGGVRFIPLLHFGALVAIDLAQSTVSVAREILTPTDYTEEGIVAVDVPRNTRAHLLLMIVAVTVTPGTAVVDADPDTGRLYLHLLHLDRADATVAHVLELAELACRALPMSDDVELST
ncbi:MAG: Na+/H+ antiporter subunit E [Actinomycetota bacterium]